MPSVLRPEGAASAALAFHHAESISSTNGNKADFFDSFPIRFLGNTKLPETIRFPITIRASNGYTKTRDRVGETIAPIKRGVIYLRSKARSDKTRIRVLLAVADRGRRRGSC
jgi:hypothetical protein